MVGLLLCVAGLGTTPEKSSLPPAAPPGYVRRATWPETLLASREALMAAEARQVAAAGQPPRPRLGPWFTLGPIQLPAKGNSPEFDLDREFTAARLRWTQRLDLRDGWVHPLYHDRHAVYCYRSIAAEAATTLPVHLDACGELTAWLDGKMVLPATRGHITHDLWGADVRAKPIPITLHLAPGRHALLVRIVVEPRPRPREDTDPWRKATLETRRPWGTVFTGHSTETGPAVAYEKLVYGETSQLYFSTAARPGPQADAATVAREQLWQQLRRDFPDPATRRQMDAERRAGLWRLDWTPGALAEVAQRYAGAIASPALRSEGLRLASQVRKPADLQRVRALYERAQHLRAGEELHRDTGRRRTLRHQLESLRLAITDLRTTHGSRYPRGQEFLTRLETLAKSANAADARRDAGLYAQVQADLEQLRREALLANPLLDFDRLLLVKRRATPFVPSLPYNWANNSSLSKTEHDNEIAVLSPVAPSGSLKTLYRPEGGRFVGDVDLHFDADRLLFSMPGRDDCWHVFEVRSDGSGLRQVSRHQEEVDNFDPCYLPDGRILFCSTGSFAGVPCVRGRDHVGVIYRMDADGGNVRQLCFEQDQDWCPTVMHDGRILYTRWEYTDVPHFFSRLLFTMNPDGTGQRALYGSNSYWPNGIFYARPVPGHPTKVVGVVSGHHVARRSGELVLFDPARGAREADGVVQRLPGRGQKVEPVINDRLSAGTWPRFLHPFPLSEKYFLVAGQLNEQTPWAIYLVDAFDNLLLLHEDESHDLLEPVPLRKTPRPPVLPERVDWKRKDAVVHLADVYAGRGLAGVPRGQVKRLRVLAYHYAYRNMADDSRALGVHSSWDAVKVVLGTVPVHEDGSAQFRVPACTPISIQPLDAAGRALQLMRSWTTAMPGETQSCVGCHAAQQQTAPARLTQAQRQGLAEITPWYGPPRGFSFAREVQPVLDRYCAGCHDGKPCADGQRLANLSRQKATDERSFSPAYLELQRYVRRPGAESDFHLLKAAEYHASTSELVQLLEKGHHNVRLDAEAWDRLVTWIDLNVPYHGTWQEAQGCERVGKQGERRRELLRRYTGIESDLEAVPAQDAAPLPPILPSPRVRKETPVVRATGWPFDAAEAKRRQAAAGPRTTRSLDLGNGVKLQLVLVPAGEFVRGDPSAASDEERPRLARISRPFWMGKLEVTNEQFARFDPRHDSRYMQTFGITSDRGFPLNRPAQPVVRVSWQQARAFCAWLSAKTGERFTLPTEEQWEYACRAGTTTPFFHGGLDSDFSRWANLGDRSLEHLRDYSHNAKVGWLPRDERCDDRQLVAAPVGTYLPNAWGLHDLHGNVWEWTGTVDATGRRVVRGGSWHDRPARCTASSRLAYPAWQGVFNVGFRVVCEP